MSTIAGARAWVWQQCLGCGHPVTYFSNSHRRRGGAECQCNDQHDETQAAA